RPAPGGAPAGGAARALAVDGKPLTGDGIQVRRVAGTHRGRLLVEAGQRDPAEQQVLLLDPATGEPTPLADGPGVHGVQASSGTLLLTTADADGIRRTVRTADGREFVPADLSAPLPYRVVPLLERVTEHGIPTAVVFPRGHVPGRRLPVLVDGYGGPGFQDVSAEPRRWQHRQWWADRGFAVVTVDNRGTPYVSPAFTHAVHRGFSDVTLDDQVAALHALADRHPDLDLGRVGVRGWSYGGYLSAMAVLRRPDVFHAAAAGAAPTDFRHYDTAYTERYLGLPQEHPEVYERDSLIPDAPNLTRPLLLITGLADDNVHPSHTLRLSQALTDAGRPHQLLALPGVTHMTPNGTKEKLMALELEFFRRELA
ncbi:alpha/beta hydrolase family protein, partial [Streptomyces sp. NPDC059456]|uniref:alpha/beta hydrolase family protein n=1 Tax=Streptomyces sp. NPDC059456 TaxID=3346838 RepID=UPI0036C8170E